MTRPFLFLVGVAAVLGVALGGAFIGGLVLGKSQVEATAGVAAAPSFGAGGRPAEGLGGSGQAGALQQRLPESGRISEGGAGMGRQFPGQDGTGSLEGVMAARSGLVGTVAGIQGDTLTITTAQGPVQVTIGVDTPITRVVPAALEDLAEGVTVRVTVADGDGELRPAMSISIVPEAEAGPQWRGPAGEGGFPRGRTGP